MTSLRWLCPLALLTVLLLGGCRVVKEGSPAPARADAAPGKLHAILAAATADPDIGDSVKQDLANIRDLLEEGFKDKKDRLSVTVLEGRRFTIANIRDQLKNLKIDRDDAILCYISCHGGYISGLGHVLQMEEDRGGMNQLPRSILRHWLLEKDARLSLLVSDSCANYTGDVEIRRAAGRPAWDTMRCLFLEAHGLLDMNAAAEGESAWTHDSKGSFFTIALADLLRQPFKDLDRDGDGFLHWQEVMPGLQQQTREMYLPFRTRVLKLLDAEIPRLRPGSELRRLQGVRGQLDKQTDHTVRVWSLPGADRLGAQPLNVSAGGVMVLVQELSPAARAGLKTGDVITAIENQEVKDAKGLQQLIGKAKGGVEIKYQRHPEKDQRTSKVQLGLWPAVGPGS